MFSMAGVMLVFSKIAKKAIPLKKDCFLTSLSKQYLCLNQFYLAFLGDRF